VFNVGGGELLIILLVVLIVLGPDKLPETARKIGNVVGEVRRMSSGFQDEMRSAMHDVTRPQPPRPSLEPVNDDATPSASSAEPGDHTNAETEDTPRPQASDDPAA
jgi:Tat protein translocase TatB subunit